MPEQALDRGEQELWDALVAVTITLPAALERHLNQDGLTHFEYRVLSTLAAQPGERLLLSDLSECTHASLSRLSHAVSKLERLGWLRRVPSEFSRGTFAVLTAAGAKVHKGAAPGYAAVARELLRDNSDRQFPAEFLNRLLMRTAEATGAERE